MTAVADARRPGRAPVSRARAWFRGLAALAGLVLAGAQTAEAQAQRPDAAALRRRLEALELAGQRAATIPLYRQILAAAPEDSAAVEGLARALLTTNQPEAADSLLAEWLATRPQSFAPRLLLAQAQVQRGQLRSATATLEAALRPGSATADQYRQVGDLLQSLGLYREAIGFLDGAGQQLRRPELFAYELASLHAKVGDARQAVLAYERLLRVQPQSLPVVQHLVTALVQQPEHREAVLRTLDELLAAQDGARDRRRAPQLALVAAGCWLQLGNPEAGLERLASGGAAVDPQLTLTYATSCEAAGHTQVAARAYALAAARLPASAQRSQALLRQADLARRSGKSDQAAELYRLVVAEGLRPEERRAAQVELARILLEDLDDAEGARAALQGVAAEPQADAWGAAARELLAETEVRTGHLDLAARRLAELAATPGAADPFTVGLRRAELLFWRAQVDSARQQLGQQLAQGTGHPLANDALELLVTCDALQADSASVPDFAGAALAQRRGQLDAAGVLWERLAARASAPVQQLARYHQAQGLLRRGRPDEARQALEQLIVLAPTGPFRLAAQAELSELLLAGGQTEAALRQLEDGLLAVPDDARAPALRLRLQNLRARAAGEPAPTPSQGELQ